MSAATRLGVLAVVLLGAGCLQEVDYSESLQVTTTDPALEAAAASAAERIEAATGVVVRVNELGAKRTVGLGWTDDFPSDEQLGVFWARHQSIGVRPTTPERLLDAVVLHEVIHAMGVVDHTEQGNLMGERIGQRLTSADLVELCDVAPCLWMTPEVE